IGNHLATAFESDERPIDAAALLLQAHAVAFMFFAGVIEIADARHPASAVDFDVVSAQKFVLAVELPPRNVHVHSADAIVIVGWHLRKLWKVTSAGSPDRVGE